MKRHTTFALSLLLLISSLATSCEKIIDVNPQISSPELVLNGVPSAGNPFFVYFAQSRFFLDTSINHPVSEVDMVLNVNGTDYRPTSFSQCRYFFDYVPQPLDSVSIQVQAGKETVTASTTVPPMPQLSDPIAYIDSDSTFNLLVINFTITDPSDYRNYYRFAITQRDSGARYSAYFDRTDTIDTTRSTYFFCFDRALTDTHAAATEALGGYLYSQLLTTDALIDGTSHNASLLVILFRDTSELSPYIHQYSLTVENLTPDRYRYLNEVEQVTGITSMFTEPPAIFGNVNGALGLFAGTAKRVYPLITVTNEQTPVSSQGIPLVRNNQLLHQLKSRLPQWVFRQLKEQWQ